MTTNRHDTPDDKLPIVVLPMKASPEPDFADSVCLKGGVCEHLWQLTTSYAHGNTAGTFEPGKEPRAIHRSCTRTNPEMELKGLTVHTCSGHSNAAERSNPKPFSFEKEE